MKKILAALALSALALSASAQTYSVTATNISTGVTSTVTLLDADITTAGTWTTIAAERANFTLTAPTTVRFGTGTTWTSKSFTAAGTYACTLATFGNVDPAYGIAKSCQVLK